MGAALTLTDIDPERGENAGTIARQGIVNSTPKGFALFAGKRG